MPYITNNERDKYRNLILQLANIPEISNKGDLEFILYSCLLKYMETREQRYSTLHDATYACQHVADEFRRRFLDKREDKARQENGEIILPKIKKENDL